MAESRQGLAIGVAIGAGVVGYETTTSQLAIMGAARSREVRKNRPGTVAAGPDYATVAYDASTGARVWAKRYDGPAHNYDTA